MYFLFQLENEHTLFDYNIGLNEKVQLIIQPALPSSPKKDSNPVVNGTNESDSEKAATGEEMDTSIAPEERTANSSTGEVHRCT